SRGSRRQSVGEALIKSAARSIGSQIGRQLIRGIMGSLLGGGGGEWSLPRVMRCWKAPLEVRLQPCRSDPGPCSIAETTLVTAWRTLRKQRGTTRNLIRLRMTLCFAENL
uniref:helicase HerA-like domain-containing protein n=1 Tax=Thiolapillus sp. TaxID=2017437 RepID=UPI003AF671EE